MSNQESFYFEGSNHRAVVLFHAYTGSTADVRMTGRALNRAGYTVYCHNLTGHNHADYREILEADPVDWMQDARAALDFVQKEGYDQIAVFGLSLGGAVATRLFIDEQDSLVCGGSFCTPIMTPEISGTRVYDVFLQFAEVTSAKRPELGSYDRELVSPKLYQALAGIDAFCSGIRCDLDHIRKPYFIAEAGKDELVGKDSGSQLQEAIHYAPVVLEKFEESGHVITVGKQHKEFEEKLIQFLNEVRW